MLDVSILNENSLSLMKECIEIMIKERTQKLHQDWIGIDKNDKNDEHDKNNRLHSIGCKFLNVNKIIEFRIMLGIDLKNVYSLISFIIKLGILTPHMMKLIVFNGAKEKLFDLNPKVEISSQSNNNIHFWTSR